MSSTQRRVVITGMGAISPLGNSKEALWEALTAGRSGVHPMAIVRPDVRPSASPPRPGSSPAKSKTSARWKRSKKRPSARA